MEFASNFVGVILLGYIVYLCYRASRQRIVISYNKSKMAAVQGSHLVKHYGSTGSPIVAHRTSIRKH